MIRLGQWIGGLVGVMLMLRWFEHRQVFHPDTRLDATGHELGRPFEDLKLRTADGLTLHGWFFPADAESPRRSLAFLLCHGNAGNISHRLDHCAALLETGASVLLFDYRGYGASEGRPDEEGTYKDAEAAFDWLRARGVERIVAIGESLGGGVASELALRRPLAGLVLLTTFTSIQDLGAELFPWLPTRWLGRIKYDTRAKLPSIQVPVLILHSRDDTLIPYRHAEENHAAAREPRALREIRGDHSEFLDADSAGYLAGLSAFLDSLPAARD